MHGKKKLDETRHRLLVKVGFVFSVLEKDWQEKFVRLVKCKKLNGHCSVPSRHPDDQELAYWVGQQRTHFNKGKLRKHHERQLRKIGFIFYPRDEDWLEYFDKLIENKNEHGHCNVNANKRNPLATWVKKQRCESEPSIV